jgi:sporulation protein YabP
MPETAAVTEPGGPVRFSETSPAEPNLSRKGWSQMAYEEKYKTEMRHNLIMEGREKLSVSGVEYVESFDEEEIVMSTPKGVLFVRGQELHIEKLSLDTGDVIVLGQIDKLEYEDDVKITGGFLSRLFK